MAAYVPFSQSRFKRMHISWDCSGATQKRRRAQKLFKLAARSNDHLPSRQTRIMSPLIAKLVRLYELGSGGDDGAYEAYVDALFAPTYVYSDSSHSGSAAAADAVKANRRLLRAAMPDLRVTVDVDAALCDEPRRAVALRWTAAGTFVHDLGPVRATGAAVRYGGVFLARFDAAGEKLVAGHGAWDTFSFLAQLGVLDESVNPFRGTAPLPVPVSEAPVRPTASSSPKSAPSAQTAAFLAPVLEAPNAWLLVGTDLAPLHRGVDAEDALGRAAALLSDADVAVLFVNHTASARAAPRLVRVIYCGPNAARAQRTALSHCRLRLDSLNVFSLNFNAYERVDWTEIKEKLK
jgi:hypothetical protein